MSRTKWKPSISHSLSCVECGTVSDGPVNVSVVAETQWCKQCEAFTPHAATTVACQCECGHKHFKAVAAKPETHSANLDVTQERAGIS
jgi:hypothetical protein